MALGPDVQWLSLSAVAPIQLPAKPPTVLIAEDEDAIRRLLMELLRSAGYNVLAAASGAQALELAAAHTDPIALLVTDVSMPQMNGGELARRLMADHRQARVLFISGYSQAGALDDLAGRPDFEYLRKPFTPAALLARVKALLA